MEWFSSEAEGEEKLDISLASQKYDDFIFVHGAAYSKCQVKSQA